MDKQRWEESEKRREDQRRERVRRKKTQVREGSKVAIHSVFPMICGSSWSAEEPQTMLYHFAVSVKKLAHLRQALAVFSKLKNHRLDLYGLFDLVWFKQKNQIYQIWSSPFLLLPKSKTMPTEKLVLAKVQGPWLLICIMLAKYFKLVVFPYNLAKFLCSYPQGLQDLPGLNS